MNTLSYRSLSLFSGRRRGRLALVLSLSAGLLAAAWAQAGTVVTFRQGAANEFTVTEYSGMSDTMLRAGNAYNYGASSLLTIGGNYSALLRFDLSSMTGKVGSVDSVQLTLSPRGGITTGDPVSFTVYLISPGNAGWKEGNKVSDLATEGEASWSFLAKGAAGEPNTPWAGGGSGFSTADYDSVPLFSGVFDPTSSAKVVITLSSNVIMDWINDPASNAGIVIICKDSIGQSFYQSGYNIQSLRPTLSFEYAAIPEPSGASLGASIVIAACVCRVFLKQQGNH